MDERLIARLLRELGPSFQQLSPSRFMYLLIEAATPTSAVCHVCVRVYVCCVVCAELLVCMGICAVRRLLQHAGRR